MRQRKQERQGFKWGVRRWLAMILAVLMVISILPGNVSVVRAAEESSLGASDFDAEKAELQGYPDTEQIEDIDVSEDASNDDLVEVNPDSYQEANPESPNGQTEDPAVEQSVKESVSESIVLNEAIETEEVKTKSSESEDAITISQVSIEEDGADTLNDGLYAVTISANGGTFSDGTTTKSWTQSEEDDELYLYDYQPTRSGYLLLGYSTSQNATTATYEIYDGYEPMSSVTLYAVWKQLLTVTIDANGGKFSDGSATKTWTQTYEDDEFYFKDDYQPTRSGYLFLGFNTTQSATTATYEMNDNFTLTANVTLYAVWKKLFTVTVAANGGKFSDGSSTKSWTQSYEDEELYLNGDYQPTRSGYLFLGFNTTQSATTATYEMEENFTLTADATLYTVWKKLFTVTVDANGGKFSNGTATKFWTQSNEDDEFSIGSEYRPTRTGYGLLGYSRSKTAGTAEYGTYSDYMPTGDVTLYAVWKRAVTVTLNANGGTFPAEATGSGTSVLASDKKTLTLYVSPGNSAYIYSDSYPSRANKAFIGWATSSSAETSSLSKNLYASVTSNKTYYAVWADAVTITLKANGGAFPSTIDSSGEASVSSDKKTVTIKAGIGSDVYLYNSSLPTKSKKMLKGWGTSTDEAATDTSKYLWIEASSNVTYYAIWADVVTITLKANGGRFPEDVYSSGNTTTVSSDKKTVTIKAAKGSNVRIDTSDLPTRSGKAFHGWGSSEKSTEPENRTSFSLETYVTANKTYYAIWATGIAVTLKTTGALKFNKGGYTDSVNIVVAKGDTLNYDNTPSVYVKTGSSYEYLSSDDVKWGTSKSTKAANAFFGRNYKISKKVTLYAINAKTVKLTWNANGGTINGKKSITGEYTYANDIYNYSTPTKSGSTFVGWSTTKKSSGLIDFYNPVYALKKTTYYAIWENGYKLTIKGNGGVFTSYSGGTLSGDKKTMTVYIRKGEKLNGFSFAVTKEGKTLTGLATTAKGKAISNRNNYRPSGNLTLYAVTEVSSYEITYNANGGIFSDGSTVKKRMEEKDDDVWVYAMRAGYEMAGWYTAKKGGKRVYTVTKKMTVYAHWKKGITVTWNANGGSLSRDSYQPKEIQYLSKNSYLNDDPPTAYSATNDKGFAGWSTSKNGTIIDIDSYKVTKNISLYAIWESGDDLADGRIELSKKRYTYTGKPVKPSITVYDREGKKVSSNQYVVSYESNNGPGYAYIQIRGKGKKGGTLGRSFYINYEARSNILSAKTSGKTIKVSYSSAVNASKYEVYAQNKNTGAVKSITSKTTSATIKKLGKGTYNVYVIPWAKSGDGDGSYMSSGWRAGTMKTVTVK